MKEGKLSMSFRKNNLINYIIWLLVLIMCVIVILLKPSNSMKNTVLTELSDINTQIEKQKNNVEYKSPLSNNIDLEKEEETAIERLKSAFTGLLGGIHSNQEYVAQKNKYQSILGKELEQTLYRHGYNNESDVWSVKRNEATIIGFSDVSNKNKAKLCVITIYTQGNLDTKISYMYNIDYDLENQQVLDYSEQSLDVQNN